METDLVDFARLVSEMRRVQRNFFRTRDYTLVERAKQLERQVDEVVREILEEQPKLF